jgi:hypothetical protein
LPPVPEKTRQAIRISYESEELTCLQIASKHSVSLATVMAYARNGKWKKHQWRETANRTLYRQAAANKLKRPLLRHEQVHHKDGNNTNNIEENLYVYPDAKRIVKGTAHYRMLRLCFTNKV